MGKIDGLVVKCEPCGVRRIIPADCEYINAGPYLCTLCGKDMVIEVIHTEKKDG